METTEKIVEVLDLNEVLELINLPAIPEPEVELKAKANELVTQALDIAREPLTDSKYGTAVDVRTTLKKIEKFSEQGRLDNTAPARAWVDKFNKLWRSKSDIFTSTRLCLDKRIREYDNKKAAEHAAEQKRIADENLAAEKAKQKEEERRTNISLGQGGDGSHKPVPEPVRQAAPAPLSLSRKTKYIHRVVATIEDPTLIPDRFLRDGNVINAIRVVVQKEVSAEAKGKGGAGTVLLEQLTQIPGVSFRKEKSISS